ncbi:hypothetical protein BDM02DRAFT_3265744 [Thelephora ganbajun]|uniref:Uncharacterized protein n=1 Tax=Thelephora ganbajun TaxID=370292 RepID=A0ACB6ZUV4_THEGA|nr:hypothetical protein BDM02DRAFT_3265744 [Thelephora ganbajun]
MPPSVKLTPRSSLDSKFHSTVDGVLKELKTTSRELQKIIASFRLELELLDRLFYKNKNQHRGALFWRKVTEMRRFSHKLDHYKPDRLVEDTRRWFWGPLDQQSPKMLKGSWTHCPDDRSLENVTRRLQLCRTLCNETSRRLMKAFEHFLLCLQSAAFAPLLLTFCAISARFNSQIQGIADLTLVCSKALTRLLQKPTGKSKPSSLDLHLMAPATTPSVAMVNIDSTMETVGPDAGPPPPNIPIVFVPPPVPPLTEEQKTRPVAKKPKKRPRDEIDDIFGF